MLLPFFNDRDTRMLYRYSPAIRILVFIKSLLLRPVALAKVTVSDFIFIHREAIPAGPPVMEWIISKVMRKKVIYDFDDAIWLTDKQAEPILEKLLRWRPKAGSICRWSYKVSCGNRYLAGYAARFNKRVVVNPTTIDIENVHNPGRFASPKRDGVTIGWTGSHSTLKYLEELEPVLQRLQEKYQQLCFLVIADHPPKLGLKNLAYVPWSIGSEVRELLRADIGIMPIPDDEWSRGKCGFKALQYMALEIPAVVSSVGVNVEIVDHGVNGFCCATADEWMQCLEKLVVDKGLRKAMGKAGREKVSRDYSVESNAANFLSLFQ